MNSKSKKYKVYKLIHRGIVVYVGITTKTLTERKKFGYRRMSVEHLAHECYIELIEETDDKARERYWIEFYAETVVNKRKAAGFDKKQYNRQYMAQKRAIVKKDSKKTIVDVCLRCEQKFEKTIASKKYCSRKCKVYAANERYYQSKR